MSRDTRPRRAGFTTMEALVGAAVTLSALATMVVFLQTQLKAIAIQDQYSQSQTVTRTAVDLLARELRMAGHDPQQAALAVAPGPHCPGVTRGIVEAERTSLRFQQDLDGDGVIKATGEDVTYALVGDQLVRRDGDELPLVDHVAKDGVRFRYFDGGNPATELVADPVLADDVRDCVARVQVTIAASPASARFGRAPAVGATVETEVAIRSRALLRF